VRRYARAGALALAFFFFAAPAPAQQRLDGWRTAPGPRSEEPGGKNDRKKKQKKNDRKKEKPSDKSPQQASPAAPAQPSGPGAPSLAGLGLPLETPAASPAPPSAPAEPASATAPPAAPATLAPPANTPPAPAGAPSGPAAIAPAPMATPGGAPVVAAVVPVAAGGATPIAPVVLAGAAPAGGVAPIVLADEASSLFVSVPLTADGAAIVDAEGAAALIPASISLLPESAGAALQSDAELADTIQVAKRDLDAGNPAIACHLLEQAFATKRSPENLAALAHAYEVAGRAASAWLAFRAASAAATDPATKSTTDAEARRIEASVAKLTLAITPGTSEPRVLFDGLPVDKRYWGKPLPLDPGSHAVVVSAAGLPEWQTPVVIASDTSEVTVRWPAPRPAVAAAPEHPWYVSTRVLVVGSATLVAAAAGAAFGAWTLSAKSDFDAHNGAPGYSASQLSSLRSTAETRGLVTNILFGASIVGLGATVGLVAWDLHPHEATSAKSQLNVGAWVVPGAAGLSFGGGL
jgi:hypothetical protein